MSNQANEPKVSGFEPPKERIVRTPGICGGRPRINGTRWAIDVMVKMIAGGESKEYLLREFPELTWEDWQAALNYAADASAGRVYNPAQ